MKILCIFVRHGATSYPSALEALERWYASNKLVGNRTLWVIDNSLPPSTPAGRMSNGAVLLPGDNRAWEFSAWKRVLREYREDVIGFDALHFVTSAFNTLYTEYLVHFRAGMLDFAMSHGGCLGHIDGYDNPIEIAGRWSAAWVRTCFFFLPVNRALEISTWAQFDDPTQFFVDPASTEFRHDAPISADYQNRIRTWLEGHEIGGNRWHSPIGEGTGESARFQRKTLAIVNEHNFSITLRQIKVPLIDYFWLWNTPEMLERPFDELPDEMSQLAVRRRIFGIST